MGARWAMCACLEGVGKAAIVGDRALGVSGARNFWLSACWGLGRTATWRVRRRDGGCETERTSSQQQLHSVPGAETTATETKAAHGVEAFQNSAHSVRGAIPLSYSATGMSFTYSTMIGLAGVGRTEHSHSVHVVVTARTARLRSPN